MIEKTFKLGNVVFLYQNISFTRKHLLDLQNILIKFYKKVIFQNN